MIADPGTGGIDGIIPDISLVERVIRQLKEQCIHRHRFDSIRHAARVIGDWIGFDNNRQLCGTPVLRGVYRITERLDARFLHCGTVEKLARSQPDLLNQVKARGC